MAKIDAKRSTPHQLWHSIDKLMGQRHALMSVTITADEMHSISTLRWPTYVRPPLMPHAVVFCIGCVLRAFRPLTVADVVRLMPEKQCNSDPLPIRLLKVNIDVLAPFLVELFNQTLAFLHVS